MGLAVAGKAGTAFAAIGFAALAPFVRDDFDLSTTLVGGVLAVVFFGAMLAIIPAGRATDRWRSGHAVGGFMLLIVAGLAVAATASSTIVFFVGVGVIGIGYGAVDPGTNVLVSSNTTVRRRGILMGVSHSGLTIGGLLGGLILPGIAVASSWRVAVLVPIVAAAVIACWGLILGGPTRERLVSTSEPVRPSSLLNLGAYGFVMAGIQTTILALLAVYLVDRARMTETTAGIAVALLLAGATLGRVGWGWLSDRFFGSRTLTLELASLGTATGLVLVAILGETAIVWPVLFGLGFCSIGWNGVWVATAAESVPLTSVGRATSAILFFAFAGGFVLPPALGEVVDGTDSWVVTWLAAAALVAALVVAFGAASRLRPVRA